LIIAASKLAAEGDETADYALGSVLKAAEEKFTIALDWYEEREWEEKIGAEKIAAAPEPIARQARAEPIDARRELLQVVDEVNEVRRLIDAASMAAETLENEERNPIQAVLGVAEAKLTAARDRLNVARGAPERKAA
jgi:hypothetical protein